MNTNETKKSDKVPPTLSFFVDGQVCGEAHLWSNQSQRVIEEELKKRTNNKKSYRTRSIFSVFLFYLTKGNVASVEIVRYR